MGADRLWDLLRDPRLSYIHWAPPCGTASRAREKKLSRALRLEGWPEPQPLRSEAHPRGLPDLPHAQRCRVESANTIYDLCAKVCSNCFERGIPFSIENPGRSWFWSIPSIVELLTLAGVDDVMFQHCMFGGLRAKLTRLRCFPSSAFQPMAVLCSKDHEHPPWSESGKFHTAEETEYPRKLCQALAACAQCAAASQGLWVLDSSVSGHKLALAKERASAGRQARGDALPPVVPEFKATDKVLFPAAQLDAAAARKGEWSKAPFSIGSKTFDAGAKVLQVSLVDSGGIAGPPALPVPVRLSFDSLPPGPLPQDVVYRGRACRKGGALFEASPWANPFPLHKCSSRSDCLDRFRSHLLSPGMSST